MRRAFAVVGLSLVLYGGAVVLGTLVFCNTCVAIGAVDAAATATVAAAFTH